MLSNDSNTQGQSGVNEQRTAEIHQHNAEALDANMIFSPVKSWDMSKPRTLVETTVHSRKINKEQLAVCQFPPLALTFSPVDDTVNIETANGDIRRFGTEEDMFNSSKINDFITQRV